MSDDLDDDERYSVYQFLADGRIERVRDRVPAQEAVEGAHHYVTSIGAQLGTTLRVIITDDGDCTNFEWRHGEGIVFPPALATQRPEVP